MSNSRISDEAWAYQWNTTEATYVHEHADMNENGSTAHRLPLISSDDIDANLSTSHASMEESSAIWEDDPRIPNGSWGGQRNTQYYPADVTSTMHDSRPQNVSSWQRRFPPFWHQNPQVWFHQIEAQICLYRITSEMTHYFYVASFLPPGVASELSDVLSTHGRYTI
ncbi:hypothetical protein HPB49_010008 [Dermacentor silvarum]|uniref:Uncharacterized protein n=1 Tax=Dermacentor silvarum TaxID=543639 RepID=A0ACB8DIW5_DERSI|nr:hypothetical protein HPB49_010008 [Dermacentor silvarum]